MPLYLGALHLKMGKPQEALRFLSGMERPATLDGAAWLDIGTFQKHGFVLTPRKADCQVCGRFSFPENSLENVCEIGV